ncbi:MAG: DUF5658 family protein [Planctomycetota bacterium]|jgi:hypothetical protein|nr:DUF5658 family protein [Planctomycetota bacterium]MDP6839824.1 DUF5658 family protein [Planctomycetota bacterium]
MNSSNDRSEVRATDVASAEEGGSTATSPDTSPDSWNGLDRRLQGTPRFSRFSFWGGRRRALAAGVEREGSFVDVYSARLLLAVFWIALMNAADSFFTMIHLQHGGIELNPVAGQLLRLGRWEFVLAKSALIAAALVVLVIHKNFLLARVGLFTAAGAYTLLVAYHLFLFT